MSESIFQRVDTFLTARALPEVKAAAQPVIIVTGASSGIGKEIALLYAKRPCRLVLAARSIDKLEEVAEQCNLESDCEAMAIQTDVTSEDDCKRLINTTVQAFGQINSLVLNAGANAHITFAEMKDLSVFTQLMQVNFFGYLYCTKPALPHLLKSNGRIVVLSSYSGLAGLPMRSAYCASKFAVNGFFESLRQELQATGSKVSITIASPASVQTKMRENQIGAPSGHPQLPPVPNPPTEFAAGVAAATDRRMLPQECARRVIEAADARVRTVILPWKGEAALLLRHFFPDVVDGWLRKASKI